MINSGEKLDEKIKETEAKLHSIPFSDHLISEYNKGLLKAYRDCLPLIERLEKEISTLKEELEAPEDGVFHGFLKKHKVKDIKTESE